jgi:Inhibitor of Apoptosis domain
VLYTLHQTGPIAASLRLLTMNVFDTRLESFKPRRVPKNPSSKLTSSSGTTLVKWPHPSTFKATPLTLADAGFVYAPSVVFKDNVICFFCGKELNDWGLDDDPAEVHFDKCRDSCPWASVKCGLTRDFDDRQQYASSGFQP